MNDLIIGGWRGRWWEEMIVMSEVTNGNGWAKVWRADADLICRRPPEIILVPPHRGSTPCLTAGAFDARRSAGHCELRSGPKHFLAQSIADRDVDFGETGVNVGVDEECGHDESRRRDNTFLGMNH